MMENASTSLSTRKRSVGVTLFAILAIIISLLIFYSCAPLIISRCPLVGAKIPLTVSPELMIPFIIAVSFLISGIFILRLKNWARILFMFQMFLWAIYGLISIRAFYILDLTKISKESLYPESWIGWAAYFFLPASISIYYLTRPKVKALFSPPKGGEQFR